MFPRAVGILCAALPGSEIVLQPTQPFRDWAKYCRAPRWSIASRPSWCSFAEYLYARINPFFSNLSTSIPISCFVPSVLAIGITFGMVAIFVYARSACAESGWRLRSLVR
jgi:hypothetical protein